MAAPYVIKAPYVNREPMPGIGLGSVVQSAVGGLEAGMSMYDKVTKDREDKLKQYVDKNIQMYQLAIKARDNKSALEAHNNIVRTYGGSELPKGHVLITPDVKYQERDPYKSYDVFQDGKLKGVIKGKLKPELGRFHTQLDERNGVYHIIDTAGIIPTRTVKYADARPDAGSQDHWSTTFAPDGTMIQTNTKTRETKEGKKYEKKVNHKVSKVGFTDDDNNNVVYSSSDPSTGIVQQFILDKSNKPIIYTGPVRSTDKKVDTSGKVKGLSDARKLLMETAKRTDAHLEASAMAHAKNDPSIMKDHGNIVTDEDKEKVQQNYVKILAEHKARRDAAARTFMKMSEDGFKFDPKKFNEKTMEYGDAAVPAARPDALGSFLRNNGYGAKGNAVQNAVNNALSAAGASPSPSPSPTAPPVVRSPSPSPRVIPSQDPSGGVGDYDGRMESLMFNQRDTAGYAPGETQEMDLVDAINLMDAEDAPGYGYSQPYPMPAPPPRAPVVVRPPLPVVKGKLPRQLSQWAPLVQKYAAIYNVPEQLIWDTMWAESGGNAGARSPVGAVGLMQLMPGTAAGLHVNPNIPEQNIEGGVKYLSQQLKAFGGNETLARAAYNAGPGAVRKYGGVPPYKETQGYVKRRAPNVTL